jgi:hypothetical protein
VTFISYDTGCWNLIKVQHVSSTIQLLESDDKIESCSHAEAATSSSQLIVLQLAEDLLVLTDSSMNSMAVWGRRYIAYSSYQIKMYIYHVL